MKLLIRIALALVLSPAWVPFLVLSAAFDFCIFKYRVYRINRQCYRLLKDPHSTRDDFRRAFNGRLPEERLDFWVDNHKWVHEEV